VAPSQRLRRVEAKDGWVIATGCVGPFYIKIAVFYVLGQTTGTVYQWFSLKTTVTVSPGLASKPMATVSPDLASKPVASGFPGWASKPEATIW
jgi:hypothetical protein